MATANELQEQLKKAKKELRETRKEIEELKIREKFYQERLDNWAEKNQKLNLKISNMTFADVTEMQKERAKYIEEYQKDKEITEAFEKQAQVKLGDLGTKNNE